MQLLQSASVSSTEASRNQIEIASIQPARLMIRWIVIGVNGLISRVE